MKIDRNEKTITKKTFGMLKKGAVFTDGDQSAEKDPCLKLAWAGGPYNAVNLKENILFSINDADPVLELEAELKIYGTKE